ncbi:formate acetyltransferase [Isosphaera pallida ATCC 43644]|uniref:Formate acetyltransferase n=1 Tax=Isosphaera pallida (strain ATCC 43644 / DSM 9630 / IS1B) TaxID=575540 RepID=E8QXD2_ISOPI|nr:formate C-acetyltransferase [Isosphaera pallida]ADV61973.1 formate acetyltransferase [Isosphaera pallida ATCC 43644]
MTVLFEESKTVERGAGAAPPRLDPWRGFKRGEWSSSIDVADFIQRNVEPYEGDDGFLAGPTPRTQAVWAKVCELKARERERGGVLDVSMTPQGITAHPPGWIDCERELIVGLQTDAPLKRGIYPFGGLGVVVKELEAYGYQLDPTLAEIFTKYRKTHNQGVFDAYTETIRRCRSSHLITGLPDGYSRGRIIGDYRRVPLYGVDRLIEVKRADRAALDARFSTDEVIRDREELTEQIRALGELKAMAAAHGFDVGRPAETAREAIQWLYFAYLGTIKEADGAAMSLGRVSTFLDIYLQRDLAEGRLDEMAAQELIDDLVIKLRLVRFMRTPEYNALFSGDPTWVTEAIGGMSRDGRPLVTRTSFRFLQTLFNLGPAPEPNLTVLWSPRLPEGFKRFCAKVSIATSSIQYENDELLRRHWSDDTGIACCVSAMKLGKMMQYFGARVNLAKALLYAINGGRDELTGKVVAEGFEPITSEVLDPDEVMERFDRMMDWLAETYVNAMNVIHYMHDKYNYERLAMALHDSNPERVMAFGIAGLAVVADSLAAIRYARVRVKRNERGLAVDYEIEGDSPRYGNNDDRVDRIAADLVSRFMEKLRRFPLHRGAKPTQSVLTITSNVVYGQATGNTPDGRRQGEPFSPGANPMNGRDESGFIASALSVAKLPYANALDGISLTHSIVPSALGRTPEERIRNLVAALDVVFDAGLFHLNVNVLDRQTLLDAMEHPENHPQLTVRVSGYAVHFVKLTREQQLDVIRRTFHGQA